MEVEGEVEGFGRSALVTDDLEEVLRDSRLVIANVPAFAHGPLAERCAPYLRDGQMVLLNPGRTFGALEFRRALTARAAAPTWWWPRPPPT